MHSTNNGILCDLEYWFAVTFSYLTFLTFHATANATILTTETAENGLLQPPGTKCLPSEYFLQLHEPSEVNLHGKFHLPKHYVGLTVIL